MVQYSHALPHRAGTGEVRLKTYLTKTVGDMTIVYYVSPNLGECHVAYYFDGAA